MPADLVIDIGARAIRKVLRLAQVGDPAAGGGGGAGTDSVGDAHGIDFTTFDVLLRKGAGFGNVEYSTDGGGSWSGPTNFGTVVNSFAAGTKFKFQVDVYRGLSVHGNNGLKNNMHFMGAEGFETLGGRITGARNPGTAGWTLSGGQWFKDITFTAGPNTIGVMDASGAERDQYPEDLWVDDVRWRHLTLKADVNASGEFHIEYDTPSAGTHRVWIGVDPATLTEIELATESYAIIGKGTAVGDKVTGVKIQNLLFDRYATVSNGGCLGGGGAYNQRGMENWEYSYVKVTECHGLGATFGPGQLVNRFEVSHCGQMGYRSDGEVNGIATGTITLTGVWAHDNGELAYKAENAGGGGKSSGGAGGTLFIRDYLAEDNDGYGLWLDDWDGDFDIESIKCVGDSWGGVHLEIQNAANPGIIARLRWFEIINAGNGRFGTGHGNGVEISNAHSVTVTQGTIDGCKNSGVKQDANPLHGGEPSTNAGNVISDLDVRQTATGNTVAQLRAINGGDAEAGITFTNNTWRTDGATPFQIGGSAPTPAGNTDDATWDSKAYTSGDTHLGAGSAPVFDAAWAAMTPRHYGPV